MKAPKAITRILAILVFTAMASAEQCPFLEVSAVEAAAVQQGVQAVFPISVINHGTNFKPVYLSASADPAVIQLEFTPVPNYVLSSGEEKTFNLLAGTENAVAGTYSIALEVSTDEGAGTCTQALNLALNVTASATPTPEPIDQVQVRMEPSQAMQKFPGEKAEYTIFVTNGYEEEVIVSLESADNAFSASTRFSEKTFRVSAGTTKTVKASVTVPPGTPGGIYPVVLRATVTTACCLQEFLLPASISVFGETAVLTALGEPLGCVAAKQGGQASFELGLRNDGGISGPFELEVAGDEDSAENVGLQIRSLELNPGERTWFNVTISPTELTPTGLYRFTLQAKYLDFTLYQRDYCYIVEGVKDLEIEKPVGTEARRCSTDSFQFKLKNVGTLEDTYSAEARPLVGANVFVDPAGTFSLSPGETQIMNVILGISCTAPLGTQVLQTRIYSGNGTRSEAFEVTIVPDEARQQFLKITAPSEVTAVQGAGKTFIVSVTNGLSVNAENTAIAVKGVPEEWVEAESPKTIKSGATASFRVRITPETPGEYSAVVEAASGLEKSSKQIQLSVEPESKELDFSYETSFAEEDGQARSVTISMVVTNNGNVELRNIGVSTSAPDVNIAQQEEVRSLAPGESRRITAVLRPLAETPQKTIPLTVRSNEGAVETKAVSVPALKPEAETAGGFDFPWKIVAIIVLLILIFALLAKGEETYQL